MSAYAVSTRGLAGRKVPQGVLTPMGDLLFSASEQGAWYDPSDISTLFQDSAGTTPVTAVEQPVGRILDKSGRGKHAGQATTTKRPIYSRRVNLLTKTEQFDYETWLRSGGATIVSITPNTDTAPDGTLSADTLILNTANSYIVSTGGVHPVTPGMKVTLRIHTKSATRILVVGGATPAGTDVYAIESLAGGWYLQTVTRTFTVTLTGTLQHVLVGQTAGPGSYVIWGASLTLAADAHLPYQRVNTATDYDADPAKFPAYLRFDGVDDGMVTNSIDFSATDKMTVVAGVSRIANGGIPIELSTAVGSNAGSFYFFAGARATAAGAMWAISSRGSAVDNANQAVETAANYNAPLTNVVTGAFDISGDSTILRINGGQIGSATGDQGTGNYGNYPLYIGARAGSSLFFNGRLYQLIVRGAQSSLSQIEATEAYIKQKMRLP